MGSKRNVDMSATTTQVKVVEAKEPTKEKKQVKKVKPGRSRSKKYQQARSQVDKTKLYDPKDAIELLKKISYSRFVGSVEAHLVLKENGLSATFTFPYGTGKSIRVAIADNDVLTKIEKGEIDFDVLLATPKFMPKLTKYARILGPKGLMPNPKNGTLTPNPELKKKELEAGSITVKTEKKAPLVHLGIGKLDMSTEQLVANLQALLQAFRNKILKASLSATMSPGVKIKLD